MSKGILFAVGAVVVMAAIIGISLFWPGGGCHDFSVARVQVGTKTYKVAVAESALEHTRGLGGCQRVPDKKGMYFVYTDLAPRQFWMKGMLVPIDIVWIAKGEVVAVTPHVPPPSGKADEELPRYQSPEPVDAVLEVAAGQAEAMGLRVGTRATFTR